MARAIDQKIVQMKMDDSDFSSKVQSVLSKFGDLTKGFQRVNMSNVKDASNSIGEIADKAGGSTSAMGRLEAATSSIANKFTVLGQVGQAAIANITNRLVDLGLKLAKNVTIQPLIDGYNEYANKLQSINVIMNNVPGAKLANVKDTLNDLNTYADKTIYSFEDMTSSMGTFTAAGVGLKDSRDAIQGIGNLAAVSGSNTQQMSMAMYQLSQALANGKVNLQDWNSVNNAMMGGTKFQHALEQTAKELGHGRDMSKSFRDSLQDGWLTSEVLLKTLRKFKDDKSMEKAATQVRTFGQVFSTTAEALGSAWAQIWENILGDSNEAPVIWTKLANAIQAPIKAMDTYGKSVSKAFHDMGGRDVLIRAFTNVLSSMGKILGTISDAFKELFPAPTAKQLMAMAEAFEKFSEHLKISKTDLGNIHDTFKAFFSLIKLGLGIVKMAAGAIAKLIPDNLMSMVLEVTGALGRFIISAENGKANFGIFTGIINKFKAAMQGANKVLDEGGSLVDFFVEKMKQMGPTVKDITDRIGSMFGGMFAKLKASFSGGSIDPSKMIAAGGIGAIALFVKKLSGTFEDLADFFKKGGPMQGIISGAKSVLGGLSDSLNAFTASVKTKAILAIAGAMTALALALKILSTIDAKDVFKSLEMLAAMLFAMNVSLTSLSKISGSVGRALVAAAALNLLALAVDEIVVAVYAFGKMKPDEFIQGMAGMAGTIMIMVAALSAMSQNVPKTVSTAGALVLLAGAVDMIALAVVGLGLIPTSAAIQGVTAVTVLLGALAIFIKVVEGAKFRMSTALSVVAIAAAVNMLAVPIIALGYLDFNKIATGILALGAILLELGVFAQVAGGAKTGSAAVTLVAMSFAIGVITVALAGLARISFDDLVKGIGAIAVVMVTLALAMTMAKGGIGGAVAITIMAGALNILIPPLLVLSKLSMTELVTGLTGLAGVFIILGAAGFALAPAVPALIGLGGAIALIGAGAALAGVGLSAFAIGLGLLATTGAGAIYAIGATISGLVDVMIELTPKFQALGIAWLHALIDAITTQIPYILQAFAKMMLSILDVLNQYAPSILQRFLDLVFALLDVITANIGTLVTKVSEFLIAFAQALGDNAEPLLQAGIQLIVKLINGMANALRDNQNQIVDGVMNAVEAVVEIIITALTKVMTVLFGWIPGFKGTVEGAGKDAKEALRSAFGIDGVASDKGQKAVDAVNGKKQPMNDAGTVLANAAKDGMNTLNASGIGGKKGGDFANGIGGKKPDAFNNGSLLAQGARNGAQGVGLDGTGSNKGQEFVNGLWRKGGDANGAGQHVASQGKDGASSGDYYGKGQDAGQGYVNGIGSYGGTGGPAWQAGSLLAQSALQGLQKKQNSHSPSKATRKLGVDYGDGYALGIDDRQSSVVDSAQSLAAQALSVMADAGDQINKTLEDNMNLDPTITPVIDASKMNTSGFNLDGTVSSGQFFTGSLPSNSQNEQQVQTIKLDTTGLDAKLDALIDKVNSGVNVNVDNVYGNLDEVTARKWAAVLSVAIAKQG